MKLKHFFSFLVLAGLFVSCQPSDPYTYVLVETEQGNMKIRLFNSTPKHRDNFVKLIGEGFYDSLLFHRVIRGFMLQGGDPDSRNATQGQTLGMGGPGYQIDAEIAAPHIKGAVAAARTGGPGNPEKRSSGSQFYIVQGQPVNDAQLDNFEQQKGIKYSEEQRKLYKELGGTPFLDMEYTVFGEVVEGMDVIDKIASVPTSAYVRDRPNEDVRMKITLVD